MSKLECRVRNLTTYIVSPLDSLIHQALYLIENGANVNIHNAWYETPVMVAADEDDYEIVKSLLGAGASTCDMNWYDETVLDIVVPGGRVESMIKRCIISSK